MQEDKYENILTLIGYYDIESRTPIRLLMLQVFGVLCGLDREIISVLLSSILPNELGRDINNHLTGQGEGKREGGGGRGVGFWKRRGREIYTCTVPLIGCVRFLYSCKGMCPHFS